MPTVDNALVILTKAPEAGQSKTRLVPPLSFAEAADLAGALFVDQLENLARFTAARLFVAFTPLGARDFFADRLPPGASCFCQVGQSLGDRMRHAFEHVFASGYRQVILIGGDLPVLPHATLTDAFAALADGNVNVALGPSRDGGYYLVGMNEILPDIFSDISWGGDDVLAKTIEKLDSLKKKYKLMCLWYDIDTIGDLRRFALDVANGAVEVTKNTSNLLQKLKHRGKLY
jgi:rSAM/selenodomain-associated transferase 1